MTSVPDRSTLTVLPLRNTPLPYDWGIHGGIDQLQGTVPPSSAPQAELWYGTHPHSPARVVRHERELPLPDVLGELGQPRQLPVLLKILAVGRPLSLQVHPDAHQAAAGYAAEAAARAAGVPVNYSDPHPKPEMLCAVSERFEALAGVRPAQELREVLEQLGRAGAEALRDTGVQRLDQGGADSLVRWAVQEGPACSAQLSVVIASLRPGAGLSADRLELLRVAAAAFPGDRGLFLSVLLNRVLLRRGEVLALPAGQMHSYQRGIGVELMASSDNVLRCGFTSKRVDVAELLHIGQFSPSKPLRGIPMEQGGVISFQPLPGLRLRRVLTGQHILSVHEPTLALALGGHVQVAAQELSPTEGALLVPGPEAQHCPVHVPDGAALYAADTGAAAS